MQIAEIAAREALSPVERLELTPHPWVGFAAGSPCGRDSRYVHRILGGGSSLEAACSLAIGFTMALFIANLAFGPNLIGNLMGEAKLGIFAASVVSTAAGLALLSTSPRVDPESGAQREPFPDRHATIPLLRRDPGGGLPVVDPEAVPRG